MARSTGRSCFRTVGRRLRTMATAAVAAACLAPAGLAQQSAQQLAQQQEAPAAIVAAQIRSQGYACSAPVSATRDRQASRPNATVWVLRCQNARYRVRLVPDMAAQVTQLE